MILGLANSLFRLFRENSDVVPVSRLQKEGVRSVAVLDYSRVEQLIQNAVAEALARHGVELSREAMDSVNGEAREVFARLLEQRDRLRETAQHLEEERGQLRQNLDLLHRELSRATGALAHERQHAVDRASVPVDAAAMADYAARLEAELAKLLADGGDGALARSVSGVALKLLKEERDKAFARARDEQQQRIATLERRIQKLSRMLGETEAVVERLKAGQEADEGVASVYKEVQGLKPGAPSAEAKRGILDEIFRINVELRQVIQEAYAGGRQPPERAGQNQQASRADA